MGMQGVMAIMRAGIVCYQFGEVCLCPKKKNCKQNKAVSLTGLDANLFKAVGPALIHDPSNLAERGFLICQ